MIPTRLSNHFDKDWNLHLLIGAGRDLVRLVELGQLDPKIANPIIEKIQAAIPRSEDDHAITARVDERFERVIDLVDPVTRKEIQDMLSGNGNSVTARS